MVEGSTVPRPSNRAMTRMASAVKKRLRSSSDHPYKAKAGIIAMKENDGKMTEGWSPAVIKDLKSNPGCASNIDFKRYDIENKIRSIFRA